MEVAYVKLGKNAFDGCVYDGHGGRKEASKKKTDQAFAREQSGIASVINISNGCIEFEEVIDIS